MSNTNIILSLLKILLVVFTIFFILSVFALVTIKPVRYGISYSTSQVVNDIFIWVIGLPAGMLNSMVSGEGFSKFFSYRALANQYFEGATSKGYFLASSIIYAFLILVLGIFYKILKLAKKHNDQDIGAGVN